jgi:hypothetical protein
MLLGKPKLSNTTSDNNNFFCEIDRINPNEFNWIIDSTEYGNTFLNIIKPKKSKISNDEKKYIQSYINNLHSLFNEMELNHDSIDKLIDIDKFIDYILLTELTKNYDAYALSLYFSKLKNKPLEFGPFWDYDIAYGNACDSAFADPRGWCYESKVEKDVNPMLNWAKIMLNDSIYTYRIKERWQEQRNTFLSYKELNSTIENITAQIETAKDNYKRVIPISEIWVWPNVFVGGQYSADLFYLKNWLINRINWLDFKLNYSVPKKD